MSKKKQQRGKEWNRETVRHHLVNLKNERNVNEEWRKKEHKPKLKERKFSKVKRMKERIKKIQGVRENVLEKKNRKK